VAIVGLGPTGAVLANLCGLHGLRVVVFERSPDPYPQPRACHLDAEIARVLDQCGLGEQLRELLTVSAGMEYVGPDGRRLFSFEGFEREPLLGWHEDYVFIQPEIDTMVRNGVSRFPMVDVRLGVDAPPAEQLLEMADRVVACDGATSSVRRQLGVPLVDLGYDQEWLVVDVSLRPDAGDLHLPDIIQQVCDARRPPTFVPSHARHRRWEFQLAPGEQADPWELLAPWGVTPRQADLVRAVPYRFHALVAAQWAGGPDHRVLLAGDAAHQMPPFMGQGMCSGIRDAANLAWKLAASAADPGAASLLQTYELERRPHVEAVTHLSIQAGRLLDELSAALAAGITPSLPPPDEPDPDRWSRLPGLQLGGEFPVGHQVPGPSGLDEQLGMDWAWVAGELDFVSGDGRRVIVEPRATYGHRAVLVRPDRYIAAVA
jgi:3-(3-hydroxy-phenyl)propionate hydroxylase